MLSSTQTFLRHTLWVNTDSKQAFFIFFLYNRRVDDAAQDPKASSPNTNSATDVEFRASPRDSEYFVSPQCLTDRLVVRPTNRFVSDALMLRPTLTEELVSSSTGLSPFQFEVNVWWAWNGLAIGLIMSNILCVFSCFFLRGR